MGFCNSDSNPLSASEIPWNFQLKDSPSTTPPSTWFSFFSPFTVSKNTSPPSTTNTSTNTSSSILIHTSDSNSIPSSPSPSPSPSSSSIPSSTTQQPPSLPFIIPESNQKEPTVDVRPPSWTHPSDNITYQGLKVIFSSKFPSALTLADDACLSFQVAYKECVRNHSFLNQFTKCSEWFRLSLQCVNDYKYTLKRMGYEEGELSDEKKKYMIQETHRILKESWKRQANTQDYADEIYYPLDSN
ncbi:hypothetical protein HMI54_003000 [Coelomomyces lativittatus]|nr:hypothetical protein HMI54_003000 [Coelomomyces lativittatus]KAJ1510542.1 hypothetical protein HMI55_006956 [Coelomomyces lativittatus]KAJ1511014.1 hypothetical protein HMI56_005929 [Coelomomyces lativittatus]